MIKSVNFKFGCVKMKFDELLAMSRTIYKNTADPVVLADEKLDVVWANAEALRRYPALELSDGLRELINNYNYDDILKILKTGKPFAAKKLAEPLNTYCVRLVPVIDSSELLGCQCFFEDDSQSILPDNSAERIIAGYTNEYRAPLTIIFSTLSIIARHLDLENDDKTLSYVNLISNNCYRLLRLSNNLMEVSRYRSGVTSLNLKQCDLAQFLRGFCDAAKIMIANIGITFEYNIPGVSLTTIFDPEKLTLALCNLLSNSCRFTKENNKITVKLEALNDKVLITVTDKGLGIKSDIIEKIFEPYFSYNADGGLQGSGLGLAIVKYVATQHGGTVAVSSEEGRGTRVAFTLPIKEDTSLPEYTCQNSLAYLNDRFSLLHIQLSDAIDTPSA